MNGLKSKSGILLLPLLITLFMAFTCAYAAVEPGPTGNAEANGYATIVYAEMPAFGEMPDLLKADKGSAMSLFRLPASLKAIEDEAFEGTAIVNVVLPEQLVRIGEKAFGNILTLHGVYIPERTKLIAENAFEGSEKVTISGGSRSYARSFAKGSGIPFTAVQIAYIRADDMQTVAGSSHTKPDLLMYLDSASDRERRSSWRHIGELKTEQFGQLIENQNYGRAPPSFAPCQGMIA